mgnify:FL=1|tara:strand:+ start:272 stop:736 length:465 start_codon:yes stop_codon:yes gene_type:complete
MNWMNKKVVRAPYLLAASVGVIIAVLATTTMAGISHLFPALDSKGLEAIDRLLAGDPSAVIILLFAIIIISPLIEELLFRKFLWWISSLIFSPMKTLFIISILFVLIHGSLFHAIGLIPISFFLGWLRMKTGSVKPSIVAHMANNAAASVFFFL